jgi:hypothetical protein
MGSQTIASTLLSGSIARPCRQSKFKIIFIYPVDVFVIIGYNGTCSQCPSSTFGEPYIMSMQISVDPAALSQEQREAVAGFILAYPGKACSGTCGHAVAEIHAHAHAAPVAAGATTAPALDPEIAALVKDDGEFQASVAFGGHGSPELDADAAKLNAIFGQGAAGPTLADVGLAPAAAFGVPPVPLVVSTPAIAAGAIVAPPPPANTAPITTTPGVASSVAGVDLDAKGFPWDNRIHAGTKRKNADGSWTAKRGVDPALVAAVEAQLRQVMGAAPAPLAQGVAPAPTGAVPQPVAPPPAPVPVAGAAPSMPAAPSAAPAGEVPADARQQFVGLVGRASAAIQGQKVTPAEVNQICADSGIPALPLLANRLDLVATVASRIDALIAARQ